MASHSQTDSPLKIPLSLKTAIKPAVRRTHRVFHKAPCRKHVDCEAGFTDYGKSWILAGVPMISHELPWHWVK